MKIQLRGKKKLLSPSVEQFAESTFDSKLSKLSPNVIELTVMDHNGPKKGVDKECIARTTVSGRKVIVRERHDDLYAAIQIVAQKLKRILLNLRGQQRRMRTAMPRAL